MEPRKASLDLEKELTCSICTELLYQPLTLLDCLHTFCGACLKEWFSFQAITAESSPVSFSSGATIFTCPSCRSPVRDTRHNATVATLLDMYLAAHPAKERSEAEKKEMAEKYKPGEQVLPRTKSRQPSSEERRNEEEDRRLLEEVRELSLREATARSSRQPVPRRRRESHSTRERSRTSRARSSDGHHHGTREGGRRPRTEDADVHSANTADGDQPRSRRGLSGNRQHQVHAQSSLRTLIGSQDVSERDIEREIEDFARQIQEEGLLDGLDLDNIDLSQNDELSRRITEAYRRRQRDRSRHEASRRSTATAHGSALRSADNDAPEPRHRPLESDSRPTSRPRVSTLQPGSGNAQVESNKGRPPSARSAGADTREGPKRTRRRTASAGRSTTTAMPISAYGTRSAARSQTDLVPRGRTSDPSMPRQSSYEDHSRTAASAWRSSNDLSGSPATGSNASFASRLAHRNPTAGERRASSQEPTAQPTNVPTRPADLTLASSTVPSPAGSPAGSGHQQRIKPLLYSEPSISCSRCSKAHIEYEVHYSCSICAAGEWNICLDCYRAGKGCLYWFGFGHSAWSKWEKARRRGDEALAKPHVLTAKRYQRPPTASESFGGQRALTLDDPKTRCESGTFCAGCCICTNDCHWRCDVCNEGDWGYCNNCVNQGRCCTHMLLPLAYEGPRPHGRPRSPRSPGRQSTAALIGSAPVCSTGQFKPLTFRTRCDICQETIAPSEMRYHCFSCVSSLRPDGPHGDYDICPACYQNLVSQGHVSAENGQSGWRRCLKGHRMAVVGFVEGKAGRWRFVERETVGGRALRSEPLESAEQHGQGLQVWSWGRGEERRERWVSVAASATAPPTADSSGFPPDGGLGMRANARWAWYPQPGADDELLFPKGAEIREIENINGDWYFGTYMGAVGLFPAPYVQLEQEL